MHIIDELVARKLVAQITDEAGLRAATSAPDFSVYAGFDPTAQSLHLGSLVPLLTLRRFQLKGHGVIAIVGGATGLVGDPSFKARERDLNSQDLVGEWTQKLRRQIERFIDFQQPNTKIVNNYDWFGGMDLLRFLRDVGKHFRVNAMIAKDSVRSRLQRSGEGLSFTEFSYPLLQAFDFVELNRLHGCQLQIGGSDQWGNITDGIELARRVRQVDLYGLTQPLVVRADGSKFGKTEAGTVWLDPSLTSPYAFYQYWLGVPDEDVASLLLKFTFLPLTEIAELTRGCASTGDWAPARQKLAEDVTGIVHGSDASVSSKRIGNLLFQGHAEKLTEADLLQLAQDGLPSKSLDCGTTIGIQQALVDLGLASSKAEARRYLEAGAIRLNGSVPVDHGIELNQSRRLHGRYALLQRGKKHHGLLQWVS